MTRLADIQGHIASLDGLLDIVGAMRSLAGMRLQEAQHALPGVRSYADSMARAIGASLLLMPPAVPEAPRRQPRRALVVLTAEHGFVGAFNERLLQAAEATLVPSDALLVLGSRGAALASERGCKLTWTHPMATRLAGVPDTINRLVDELYTRIVSAEVARIEVMFSRSAQTGSATIERRPLLPLDTGALARQQPAQAPLHNLQPRRLLESLLAEYVFALLTEAAVESFASENAARLAAMESARDNVDRKLGELRQSARQVRQSEITEELLDVLTGAEASGLR